MICTQAVDMPFGIQWTADRTPTSGVFVTGFGSTEAEAMADLESKKAHAHVWNETRYDDIEQCDCGACRFKQD